jgi:hypothetical protein
MKLTRSAAIALSVTALAAADAPLAAQAATTHGAAPRRAAPQANHAVATSVAVYNCGN